MKTVCSVLLRNNWTTFAFSICCW